METKIFYTDLFRKEYKKLCKKYPSLKKDFAVFLDVLLLNPSLVQSVQISELGDDVLLPIFKVKKFALSCMQKSNSGMRIIYSHDESSDTIELIEFIEIYHKNTQENHSVEFLKKHYKELDQLPSEIATESEL